MDSGPDLDSRNSENVEYGQDDTRPPRRCLA